MTMPKAQPLKVLLAEDNPADAAILLRELRRAGFEPDCRRVDTEEDFIAQLQDGLDLVISDYEMPQFSGPRAIELLQATGLQIPLIIVSGMIGEETAVGAMKLGALDYLLKDRLARLGPAIVHALEQNRLRAAHRHDVEQLRLQGAALAASANAIIITDRTGLIVWTNPAFTTLTGYTLAEILGRNPRELVKSEENGRAVYEQLWETILAGRVWHGELVNRRKDGSLYLEEQTITPVRDAGGEITHFIAIKQDLTERKLVDEMVQASRRQFQAVFEQAAVGMVIAEGPRGTFVNINRRFCEMVGYTDGELRQLSSHEITHPDDLAGDDVQLRQIGGGQIREYSREKRYRRKDGTFFWAKAFVAPLDPAEPNPTLRIGVIEDISTRKAAEAALCESERFNRGTLDALGSHVAVLDAEGTILATNRAWREFAQDNDADWQTLSEGADYVAVCERAAAAGYTDAARMLTGFRAVVAGAQPVWFHEYSCHSPTAERWFYCRITRFPGEGPVRVVIAHENISALRLAQSAQRASEERYRTLFEGNPLPMWVYDAETLHLMTVNESAVQHYGYTREEFCRLTTHQLHPAEDLARLLPLLRAGEVEGPRVGEWRHRRKDGTLINVTVFSSPIEFAGRQARLVLINDTTEKKLLEEKFLHAQRLESLGMLAAGIAHDLNNVLAPILFAAPLLRTSLSTERDLKVLSTLERSADRGASLVKQILGFAHTNTGEFRVTQLKHLARDVTDVVESTFPKSIRCDHQIPSNLWPVWGNATQIHQVLLNLCVNARDAMAAGGTLRLTLANRQLAAAEAQALPGARPGAWLVIEVADTGTGIPPEVLARIWDPFFTTKAVGRGTGLGLSTVRGIVVTHHGFIVLDTQVGRGTTFSVFLPAAEDPELAAPKPARNAAIGHGELILVVDDDRLLRETAAAVFQSRGYRVLLAADGVEAVGQFNRHAAELALVITDVDMPHLDGIALCRILARQRPDLPMIQMSGLAQAVRSASQSPFAGAAPPLFLQKPFTSEAVLEAVDELLHPKPPP